MSAKRAIGILLIIVGIVALVWGGVFWTERDTLVDAGPLEIQTEDREGVAMPPILGAIALIGGIVLVAIPERRRA
jgi:drug/metabolite transporter (DMT)-like permease